MLLTWIVTSQVRIDILRFLYVWWSIESARWLANRLWYSSLWVLKEVNNLKESWIICFGWSKWRSFKITISETYKDILWKIMDFDVAFCYRNILSKDFICRYEKSCDKIVIVYDNAEKVQIEELKKTIESQWFYRKDYLIKFISKREYEAMQRLSK